MDQDTPNTGWGTGTSGTTGTTGTGTTGAGTNLGGGNLSSGNFGSGSNLGGTSGDTTTNSPFGTTSATDSGICPHCGQSMNRGGLEQFLGRLGITEEMIGNLKTQFQNVDIDEYLNTARTYLKDGGSKAQLYAKENPGKVAAGVAALALGAGLLYAAVNRDKA
jgi:hypothetical protein